MPNFKTAAKRKRELAKLDKRQAKEQKRALRKGGRSGAVASVPPSGISVGAQSALGGTPKPITAASRKPMTLAEAAERWRNTKVVKKPKT